MWQRSGHARFEFTDDRFSRDAVPKATPTTDFIGRIQDITDYLSHLPETQVNGKYFGSEKWKFYEK